jgi:peptidyl-prolyl cis-trans isomerase SurA
MRPGNSTGVIISAVVCVLLAAGCASKQSEVLVAQVGRNPITLTDYENLYLKSSGNREQAAASSMEEREKFLGLLTNFHLKLADAYERGMDKRPDVQEEIRRYKGSLAASFLTEREVTVPGLRRMYQRRAEEIRAKHILLNLSPDASPEDSASVYMKAHEIIGLLQQGANFESLALEHSQDPTASQNKGDLYYFSSGHMVGPFEDAAYAMKVGEISTTPVRTQFGLHILKIVDRKLSPGETHCGHIMIRFDRMDPSPEDTMVAYGKIKAIQDTLMQGGDFPELAQRHSGDPGSAHRGGDLGWFARRRWVLPFDEVAFTLKPGEYSDIVRTAYGYHIIKCYDTRPPKPFEEIRKDLQQTYQQLRFQEDYGKYLANLKRQVGYVRHRDVVEEFIDACDSTKSTRDTTWIEDIRPELRARAIMSFTGRNVTVDDVIATVKERPDMHTTILRAAAIHGILDKIAEQVAYEVRAETIEKDYPEFRSMLKEYVDGILLYQIEQEQIWGRVTVTDEPLRAFFDANRERFAFPDRVDFSEIRVGTDSIAEVMHRKLMSGATFDDLLREDEQRLARPTKFQMVFGGGASSLTPQSRGVLGTIAADLKDDLHLRVIFTAYADTGRRKVQNESLASKRLDAAKKRLVDQLKIAEDRITVVVRPIPHTEDASDRSAYALRVDAEITGRRPLLLSGIENHILPVTGDERSMAANSLQDGEYTRPIKVRNAFSILRLNTREPARLKTFEEAGTEVSSAFQEYESKRLEREWLDGLRKRYRVVEYKESLKNAFAER